MQEKSGVEQLEFWLCSLGPSDELVARMALRLRFHERCNKSYFASIASLIKKLDLTTEALGMVRADAQRVAACLDRASLPSKSNLLDLLIQVRRLHAVPSPS